MYRVSSCNVIVVNVSLCIVYHHVNVNVVNVSLCIVYHHVNVIVVNVSLCIMYHHVYVIVVNVLMTDAKLQCNICMEDFQLDEPVRTLPCKHFYHAVCISTWLQLVTALL